MRQLSKRFTYANVMSSIAVFLVLGGASAFAATQLGKNTVGSKQLKKNAVTAAKIKKNAVNGAKIKDGSVNGADVQDGSLSGADIAAGTLGTVPSAATATTAATAQHLNGFTTVSGAGAEDSMTTLFNDGQFEVVGICSENGQFDPPGFQSENISSTIGIINRGQNGGFADTYDDEDYEFEIGEGVAFDYLDAGDPGTAVLPNGHWIYVLGGAIIEHQSNPNFGSACTFHAMVYTG